MIVTAKCWINYDGKWHKAGEKFEIPDDVDLGDAVAKPEKIVKEDFKSEIFPPAETPKRRGRSKKE